jgi:glycosyltransferase involved in cell wall biosynthesis
MTAFPSISVVIPARDAALFLREAIESVLAQAVPVQLILVNDGSTDETSAIAGSYGAALDRIDQPPLGLGAARNCGVAGGTSEWIAFLDADDVWMPDKLMLQLRALEADPALDLLFGHGVEFVDAAAPPGIVARTEPAPAYVAGTMLARRALFDTVGGFSENGRMGEFIDWYSRVRQSGARLAMLDDVLFRRRVHANNMTRLAENRGSHYLDVVRAHLQRRRAEP